MEIHPSFVHPSLVLLACLPPSPLALRQILFWGPLRRNLLLRDLDLRSFITLPPISSPLNHFYSRTTLRVPSGLCTNALKPFLTPNIISDLPSIMYISQVSLVPPQLCLIFLILFESASFHLNRHGSDASPLSPSK